MINRNNTAPAAASNNVKGTNVRPMTFGERFGQGASEAPAQQEADVWLNIGYFTGDADYPFVSLPFGIPVDTQKPLQLSGRNQKFLAFTQQRNDLLEAIQNSANDLAPGEEMIFRTGEGEICTGELVLQLRRRDSKPTADKVDPTLFAAKPVLTGIKLSG